MAAVPQKHTRPELAVRSLLHAMGFRFRLHPRNLPGRPDIVLPKHGAVIFVHGCFWHRHANCRKATMPKSNVAFWRTKFKQNQQRDARRIRDLEALGWRVIVVWQCEVTGNTSELAAKLKGNICAARA